MIVMRMRWDGATPDQYDRMRDKLDWENDVPDGAVQHVVWFDGGGMNIVDVWESEDTFNAFIQNHVMPAVQELGIPGQPDVQIDQAHAVNEGTLARR
jgi:hypothetical protein